MNLREDEDVTPIQEILAPQPAGQAIMTSKQYRPVTSMLLLSLSVFVTVGVAQAQLDPQLIRVFLTTADIGHPDDVAAKRESVKQLAAVLAKQKKLLVLVDKEELADLTVEVKERSTELPKVVVGIGARPGQPPAPAGTPARTVHLTVGLDWKHGDAELMNKNKPLESQRGWASAAEDVARQIERWITEHRQRLLDAR